MTISPEDFRDALRLFAAGVTLVTSRTGERRHGMTVTAFTSVSADPPLIAVVIDQAHSLNELLADAGASFAVNLLTPEHEALSNRFAFEKNEDRFAEGDWGEAVTGAPVLNDALAWLDCRVTECFPGGTHIIYLGTIEASHVAPEGTEPLIYWNRGYRRI